MNTATWMADPRVQARPINQIVLPGTHDSATFSLEAELSQVQYPNIAFLWSMNAGQAPSGFPGGETNYIGPYADNFVMDLVLSSSTAHSNNFAQQLSDGIRFFDIRAYWDTDLQDVYLQHGLRGTSLSDLLGQVATYLSSTPDGRELILLEISHTNFGAHPEGAARVVELLQSEIGQGQLYAPDSVQTLAAASLSDIAGNGSRCVILNPDGDSYPSPELFLSGASFGNSGRGPDGVTTAAALASCEQTGLDNWDHSLPLYQVAWTLTPDLSIIANEAVNRLEGQAPAALLRNLADTAAGPLDQFVAANQDRQFNLITVDWYQDTDVVAVAARLSGVADA